MYDAPLSLSEELAAQIADDYAHGRVSPWRCPDAAALRRVPATRDEQTLMRPAFVRDIEKTLNVPAYNRYAGKTQVFSFRQNDDITRRGQHVQLVSRIARDIARPLGLNLDLVEAIALAHDIGHTPFGHAGERCLDEVYHARTGLHFAHNVHSVEVMDRIYGRNLTLQALDGALCHNGEYERRVLHTSGLSSFAELDETIRACHEKGRDFIHTLAPATLEGCVVRVSDIIAYVGKDRQDAELAGLLDAGAPFRTGAVGAYNSWVIAALTVDIVENSYGKDHIELSQEAFDELAAAKRENYQLIYETPSVGGECEGLIAPRFEALFARLLDDLVSGDETSPIFAHHVVPVCRHAGYYSHDYDWQSAPEQTVMDFIASMTDDYFTALYERLFPDELGKTPRRSYFSNL